MSTATPPLRSRTALVALATPALALALTGCLERTETITVHADGAVDIAHAWKGDAQDFAAGAARLPTGPTWAVRQRTERRADGREETFLDASASFVDATRIPTRLGPAADRFAEHALTFTTTVDRTVDEERELFTFRRRYASRRWAEERYLHARYFDDVRELLDRGDDDGELADDERRKLVSRFVDHERARLQLHGELVLRELTGSEQRVPVRARLTVRDAIGRAFDGLVDLEQAIAMSRDDENGDDVTRLTDALHAAVDDTIATTIRSITDLPSRPDDARIKAAIAAVRHAGEVTQDIEDETFVVRVRLPGHVLRHNADEVDGDVLVWRFSGRDLHDRDHELLAIAAVER